MKVERPIIIAFNSIKGFRMKLLVISHNVFSRSKNMGKTLRSYFNGWNENDIAQLYVHSEIPTDTICKNYYRITDKEMIKSIFTRKSGTIFTEHDIKLDTEESRVDTGNTAKMYNAGQKRTPFIYFARNLWWKMGKWKTKKLLSWVDEFNPDVIFLASGDYSFIYDIALTLAKYKNIPLAVSCMDDYYFFNKNEDKLGGKAVHRSFMKHVRKTMDYASCIYPICEKMGRDYAKLFNKPYHTLPTPSSISEPLKEEKTNAISYIGNLGYKRNEQIITLAKSLKEINCEGKPEYIDVYSAEKRPEILSELTKENGINFHGSISSADVLSIMGKSMAVIHTESFDKITRKSVAYSVSTKIADSLASGTPILAYGPSEIASIEYLKENNSAFCITENDDLKEKLKEFISNLEHHKEITKNALALASKNHSSETNCNMIRETLKKTVAQFNI